MRRLAIALLLSVGLTPGVLSAGAGIVFGGFDSARGGISSPGSGALTTAFRAHVLTNFPDSSFKSTNTLTSGFLNEVDVVVLTASLAATIPITPLSSAEQDALLQFVHNGGGALILTENNLQFELVSDSLAQPFGLETTGVISGSTTATVTNLAHPVASGPFGTVTNFGIQSFPGWFSALGTNATGIATLNPNGQVTLAAIPPGKLLSRSGAVVFFSDTTILDGNYFGPVITLVDNAIAYVTPTLRPTLFVQHEGGSFIVSWATNHVGFRLQSATNLISPVWTEVTLTGVNEAEVNPTGSTRFFRLVKP